MGVTILIFLLQAASQFLFNGLDIPAGLGLKVNEAILQGEFWRLITPLFLHGSILHIGFNMYALNAMGPALERHYGKGRFLTLYFLSGLAGNVFSFLLSPNPSLGSSTAIFGLLGAEAIFMSSNRNLFGARARRALRDILMIALVNFVIGLSPGIDNWGHLGGLVGGAIFAWWGGPKLHATEAFGRLSVEDVREAREIWLAGVGTGLLIVLLAALGFFL